MIGNSENNRVFGKEMALKSLEKVLKILVKNSKTRCYKNSKNITQYYADFAGFLELCVIDGRVLSNCAVPHPRTMSEALPLLISAPHNPEIRTYFIFFLLYSHCDVYTCSCNIFLLNVFVALLSIWFSVSSTVVLSSKHFLT